MGQGSYKPSDPNDVVKRRFGDCKDKALLFASLCKTMNLGAYPVLVNTYEGRSLSTKLPSPLAFNHVIVRLDLEGRTLWLDPTLEYQKGNLANLYQPDYGYGLVLREGNGKLDSMEKKPYEKPTISVLQNFDLSGAKKDPAVFTVSSDFLGEDADFTRERFANRTRKDIQDEYSIAIRLSKITSH
jgi:hypothetical protein